MLVKKIIHDDVYLEKFFRKAYDSNVEVDVPYFAGKFQELIPKNLKAKTDESVFKGECVNDSMLFNQTIEIGSRGLYYFVLQKGYKIDQLLFQPDDLTIDLFVHKDGRLIYSFYNPTLKRNINIRGKISDDVDGVARKIKANLDDILLRNYFLQLAIENFGKDFKIPEYFPESMKAEQAGIYLNFSTKTIRTWTSEGKLKPIKIGNTVRYLKKDLDAFLEKHKTK